MSAFTALEGNSFSGIVTSFALSDFSAPDCTVFTATIDWGDATPTSAATSIAAGAAGQCDVSGTHTYADDGTYTVTVTVADGVVMQTYTATASIGEDLLSMTGVGTISATERTSFSGVLVTCFADPGSPDLPTAFTATIDWGDTTMSAGTLTSVSPGVFTISGTHTYADEGSYTVTVTAAEETDPGFTVAISDTANVADADSLTPSGTSFSTPAGVAFTQTVATFADTYAGNVPSDFTATIDWGDTSTSVGTIMATSPGAYTVSGTHTYAATASITVVGPPTISKAFGAASILLNHSTNLTFTITNPPANTVALTGVAVSDTLPSGLIISTPNGLTNTCGGTATAVAGSGSVSLSGGTIAASANCTVVVNVTATTLGTKTNVNGAVSSTNGGTGTSATATLMVVIPDLGISKHHQGNLVRFRAGAYTIVVSNVATAPTTGSVTVTDNLPFGLTGISAGGPGWGCTLTLFKSSLTCSRADALAASASYPPISFLVEPLRLAFFAPTMVVNVAHVRGGDELNMANDTAIDLTTIDPY